MAAMKEYMRYKSTKYLIYRDGRVYNEVTNKFLKPWLSTHGYWVVAFSVNGKTKKEFIHRLLAELFIPNPEGKPCVDHINTNPRDNRLENLRWASYKENSNNPLTIQKFRENALGDKNPKTMTGKFGLLNPRSRPICQIKDGAVIRVFECARQAMRELSIDCCSITNCCRGKRKSAGGFKWRYYNENL